MHLIIHLMYPVYTEPFRASEISYFLYCNYATFHSLPPKLPRRLSKVTSPHNTLLSSKSVFLSYTTTLLVKFLTSLSFRRDARHLVFTDLVRPCF